MSGGNRDRWDGWVVSRKGGVRDRGESEEDSQPRQELHHKTWEVADRGGLRGSVFSKEGQGV